MEIDTANAHSPSHTIKKKIQLCLDPKDLNNSLERETYYSRSIDELIAKFSGAVIFTIVDMDKGYLQVELHPDSRKYTCMALDIRRVQWKRLPMGMVVASDIFQKKLDSVYIGFPGVTGIADDMIIFGKKVSQNMIGIYSNSLKLPGRMDWFSINRNYSSRSKKYTSLDINGIHMESLQTLRR